MDEPPAATGGDPAEVDRAGTGVVPVEVVYTEVGVDPVVPDCAGAGADIGDVVVATGDWAPGADAAVVRLPVNIRTAC